MRKNEMYIPYKQQINKNKKHKNYETQIFNNRIV